jgi:glutamate synthase (NADPH/NADH)
MTGTDYGHSEVLAFTSKDPREYCISTKSFEVDAEGNLQGLNTVRVEWTEKGGKWSMEEIAGSEQVSRGLLDVCSHANHLIIQFFEAQLCFLALGFLGPQQEIIQQLDLKTDPRSNIQTPAGQYATSAEGVYAAGDCRRGQSLIV